MKNLIPRPTHSDFVYYSTPEGNAIKAEVYYSLGEFSYSCLRAARGVYVSLCPVERPSPTSEVTIIGQGIRACVLPMTRMNKRVMDAALSKLDTIIPGACDKFTVATKRETMLALIESFRKEEV